MRKQLLLFAVSLLCLMLLGACAKKTPPPATPADNVTIGIAPFSQPLDVSDLLAGYIPENVKEIDPKVFTRLDGLFDEVLQAQTKRKYQNYEVIYKVVQDTEKGKSISGFNYWYNIGRKAKVDMLIIPQAYYWQDRQGGELGVDSPAAVMLDFFMLDIKNKRMAARSRFEEQQESLSDNFFGIGKFFSRGGKWITAEQLAKEGMEKALKEFGL